MDTETALIVLTELTRKYNELETRMSRIAECLKRYRLGGPDENPDQLEGDIEKYLGEYYHG